jgi:alkylated DNA repair dioxygenase AlkB
VELVWQESLFAEQPEMPQQASSASATQAAPLTLDRIQRRMLDARSWLELIPGWLPEAADLFTELVATAAWQQRERQMYDARVLEPRLVAVWSGDDLAALPGPVDEARRLLGERYGVEFDSVLANLYRDGRDGVAWHGDRVRHVLERSVVVTLGLGERRRFLLRPGTSGPARVSLTSGEGDLIVMGGRCQHEWQHTVPRARAAGARISITMRHSAPLPG